MNFVEISPVLARKQAETLGAKIDWVGGPEDKCFMKVTAQKFNYTQFVFLLFFSLKIRSELVFEPKIKLQLKVEIV